MASLTIRNFDDELKTLLRLRAAQRGCSMEQEARDILRRAVQHPAANVNFAQRVNQRFAKFGLEELPVPKRRTARIPPVVKR